MALSVRNLTVATTVDDFDAFTRGGASAETIWHADAVKVDRLVRLAHPVPGLRCGIWSAQRGVYAVELQPHPHIQLVNGRRLKSAGLIHRSARLRDEPLPAAPPPSVPPATTPLHSAADLHLAKDRVVLGGPRFDVRGDDVPARAFRVALWLCLCKQIPVDRLSARDLALLPADRFEVDATAIAWELKYRGRAVSSGLPNTVAGIRSGIRQEVLEALSRKRLTTVFGNHRWPSERTPEALK